MDSVEARVRACLELRELTVEMKRLVLAREHPDESPAEIAARLREWVLYAEPPRGRVAERESGR